MVELTRNQEIAGTILQQLGGQGRLKVMINAQHFTAVENGLSFKVAFRGVPYNYVRVTLNGNDLYDVVLQKIHGFKETKRKEFSDIYADGLSELLEDNLGLALSLGTMGR